MATDKEIAIKAKNAHKKKLIGEGTYARVYSLHKSPLVLKQFSTDVDISSVLNEYSAIAALNNCPSQLFPKCYAIAKRKNNIPCIYMNKYDRNIHSIKYELKTIKKYMHSLINSLIYMHNRGIMHRDIKGSNILEQNNEVVLTDFNICKFDLCTIKKSTPYRYSNNNCTEVYTTTHRPIELLLGCKRYDYSAEIWAAGICFLEMCVGLDESYYSYKDVTNIGIIFKLFYLLGTPTKKDWPEVENLAYFGKWPIWNNKIDKLIPLGEDGLDLLKKMLTMDPEKRISLEEIINHQFFKGMKFVEGISSDLGKIKTMDKYKIQGELKIDKKRRRNILKWMIKVQIAFNLKIETYFSSVLMLDIFLVKINIKKEHLTLFTCACMRIMSAIHEDYSTDNKEWLDIINNGYLLDQMVLIICKELNYDLFFSSHWSWALGYINKFSDNKRFIDLIDCASYFLFNCVRYYKSNEYSLEELGRASAIFALDFLKIKHDLKPTSVWNFFKDKHINTLRKKIYGNL